MNGREEYMNADSGADLDFMSEEYAHSHCYHVDKTVRRKIEMGDKSIAYTIGQTVATITLDNEAQWDRKLDILPHLTSDIVLSNDSLEVMNIWTRHEDSFIDIFIGQARSLELNILIYLGEVANSISQFFKRRRGKDEESNYMLCKPNSSSFSSTAC